MFPPFFVEVPPLIDSTMRSGPFRRLIVSPPSAGARILLTGTILLLIVGLAIGFMGTAIFQYYVKEQLSNQLHGINIQRNDAFASALEAAIDTAMIASASGGTLRNLAILRDEPERVDSLQMLQQDADVLIRYGYRHVRMVDTNNLPLVEDGIRTEKAEQSIRLVASISAELMWSNGFVLRTSEKLYDLAGRYIGAVELERELPKLTDIYLKTRPIGSSYDSFTCGKDTAGSVSCFPTLLTKEIIRLAPLNERARLPVDQALDNESGVRQAIDYRQRSVMAAYGPVGNFGLASVAKIDEKELYAPAQELVENMLFAITGFLLAGALVLHARIRPLVDRLTEAERQAVDATAVAVDREAKLQAIIEHANDGIITMGTDGVIRSINPAGASIFGHQPSALIGQHFTTLLPERHRETGHAFFANYKALALHAQVKKQTNLITGLHADGHEIHVEMGTNQIKADLEDIFIGILHDVTESKRVQQALKSSEQRLRTITNNLPVLIAYVNRNAEYEFANITYEKWFHKPLEKIVGQPVSSVFGPDAYATIAPYVNRALQGETVRYETGQLVPGSPAYGDLTYLPDVAADGRVNGYYVLGIDISAERLAEEKLEREHELLQTILATIDVGIAACDADGILRMSNRAMKEFHAVPERELPPEQWPSYYRLFGSDGTTPLSVNEIPLFKALSGESVRHAEFTIRSADGKIRHIRASGEQLTDSKGELLGAVAAMSDVTELKEKEEQLRKLARHDTLTGLPNRLFFNEKLPEAMRRAQRSGLGIALMFLDIDHFKSINDTHGHHAGDLVLQAFAQRLQNSVRKTDTVARLAGDEFVIILEALHHSGEAAAIADKLLRNVQADVSIGNVTMPISTSIGIAIHAGEEADGETLLRRADDALYAAKLKGRSCYQLDASLVCVR